MSEARTRRQLRLAIEVTDPVLAGRITSVLADIEGLELVGKHEEADALVIAAAKVGPEPDAMTALTARELEVLALLAEGASNKQIARRLSISAHTAKYHVASLLDKLDAVSRTDAVAHAARIGVLHL